VLSGRHGVFVRRGHDGTLRERAIGREVKPVIGRFLDGMPRKFDVAEGDVRLSAGAGGFDPRGELAPKCELVTVLKCF